ncbi:hypothetical protein KNE206_04340 [Kitasatospora sp. NE20-6]|uniref:hypothetical protein n=1 Tax=Kitasatospora sp. NE20-6 TaxID=2859066 RepID=UPI0034DBFB09
MPREITGYSIGYDATLAAESGRLKRRLEDLELQLARARAENSLMRDHAEEAVSRLLTGEGEPPGQTLPQLSATVHALTEVVSRLAVDASFQADFHAQEPSRKVKSEEFPGAGDGEIQGEESVDSYADSSASQIGERRQRYWRKMAGVLAIGGLLDLHASATAQGLAYAYNRARGVDTEDLYTDRGYDTWDDTEGEQ